MSFTHQNQLRIKLKRILKILLVLYIMIGASIYFIQEKILFLPTTLAQNYQFEFRYPFEELFFKTAEDVSINALHFKNENPKGVILYFHGNGGDLSRWGIIGEHFVSLNYDVLIMDYRTYGKSKGKLSEQGFYDDAEYCYNYLLKSYSEEDILLYGRSLGTGIATYLASKYQPKQLILETPYYSILDVAKYRFPIFPLKALLKYEFPSNEFITTVNCPIMMFHGTDDSIIPYSSAQKLKSVAPENKTKFITIEGGGHNNLISFDLYKDGIKALLF